MSLGIYLGMGLTWSPWRVPGDWLGWNRNTEQKLKRQIEEITPTQRTGFEKFKVLTIGAFGHGKSSLINSVASISAGHKTTVCNAAPLRESVTTIFRNFEFGEKFGQIVFGDIRGLPFKTEIEPFLDDIKLIIKGHIKSGYEFDPEKSISPTNKQYYQESPTLSDQIHCAIIVFDINHVSEIHKATREHVQEIMKTIHSMNIPVMAVLTKTNKLSDQVKYSVESIFRCKKTQEAVKRLSEQLAIPAPKVFPVVNFEELDAFSYVDSIPILLVLRACLRMAKQHSDNEVVNKRI